MDNLDRTPPGAEGGPPRASPLTRLRRLLIGPPRDITDRSVYRRISLVSFLAWVGLGADGLSSSAYGPEEAFRAFGPHTYLALALAVVMAFTVFVIAVAYSRVIEHFPHGGGGYVVATKFLGGRPGMFSGAALLVDYVLTITISIAASGDALFSLIPLGWHEWKLAVEMFLIAWLTLLNLRGVKESVLTLAPVFIIFIVTHAILIMAGVTVKAPGFPAMLHEAGGGFSSGLSMLGMGGMFLIFIHAYSLGGGAYTGIEAVSNGLAIMREPRVQTGKRTMLYMAVSLAFTASGLLLCYLLWGVVAVEGKTMNAVLAERFVETVPLGGAFVILVLLSEGALLVVAAQAGFVDGPRVLANMAVDYWVPRRFAALSDRLTAQNGILMMSLAALVALFYTAGNVRYLVVMYSINVFITFSMTEVSMVKLYFGVRSEQQDWKRKISIHVIGLGLCLTILLVTLHEKFLEGGWITLAVTGAVAALCLLIRSHYGAVARKLEKLYAMLTHTPRAASPSAKAPDPAQPVAAVLVGGYGGLGLHTFLGVLRDFPGYFKGVVFLSVGEIDSKGFKGEGTLDALRSSVEANLDKYVEFAQGLGVPAARRMTFGADAVEEAEKLCLETGKEFPKVTFFAGRILFEREKWYQRILHNETAFAIQRRLQWEGKTVVIVPARVT